MPFPKLPQKILILLLSASPVFSGVAVTGNLGVQALSGFQKMNFGYNVAGYYKFDDQVLLGLESGQGIAEDPSGIPVLVAAYVRLPLGRVIVPVVTGGIGTAFSSVAPGLMWRLGGLLDIRNGKHSSILLGPQYEGHSDYKGGIVLRGGLLLEL